MAFLNEVKTKNNVDDAPNQSIRRTANGFGKNRAGKTDLRLRIPMQNGMRSLNVALTASMIMGEALRQTGGLPPG